MSAFLRGCPPPVFWSFNGLLTGFTTNIYLDGMREMPFGGRISQITMTQRVDGSVTSPIGVTTVELFKMTTGGSETSIVTISLTQGGGANARASVTSISTNALRNFTPNTRLGVKLTSAQTAGTDLSISLFFGS